jgi:hypothetical protein
VSPRSEERPDLLTPARKQKVQEQLERIIKSSAFCSSPRCQQLLTYVVTHAVAGSYEMLRERVVGTEVFGRTASYDTGGDSIVRVRANDVRKRLAQYYDGAPGRDHEIRIHLPTGSYVPEFSFPVALVEPIVVALTPASVSEERPKERKRWWWISTTAVGLGLLASAALALSVYRHGAPTPTLRFWAPVISSTEPALFCLGHAQVFTLSPDFRREYFRLHPPPSEPEPRAVTLAPGESIKGRDLVSVQGQFVGVGGAQAVQMLSSLLAARGKSSSLRIGSDLSFADLRSHPTILVGAFSNKWTLQMNRDVRFYFDEATGEQVLDRQQRQRAWRLERNEKGRETVDYAVVTRLIHSETGQVVVEASGITQYGCKAAGELLASDSLLAAALLQLPKDWEQKNLQIVLRSKIVGMTAGPPEILTTYSW